VHVKCEILTAVSFGSEGADTILSDVGDRLLGDTAPHRRRLESLCYSYLKEM